MTEMYAWRTGSYLNPASGLVLVHLIVYTLPCQDTAKSFCTLHLCLQGSCIKYALRYIRTNYRNIKCDLTGDLWVCRWGALPTLPYAEILQICRGWRLISVIVLQFQPKLQLNPKTIRKKYLFTVRSSKWVWVLVYYFIDEVLMQLYQHWFLARNTPCLAVFWLLWSNMVYRRCGVVIFPVSVYK